MIRIAGCSISSKMFSDKYNMSSEFQIEKVSEIELQ